MAKLKVRVFFTSNDLDVSLSRLRDTLASVYLERICHEDIALRYKKASIEGGKIVVELSVAHRYEELGHEDIPRILAYAEDSINREVMALHGDRHPARPGLSIEFDSVEVISVLG